jgi:hypothetical protein
MHRCAAPPGRRSAVALTILAGTLAVLAMPPSLHAQSSSGPSLATVPHANAPGHDEPRPGVRAGVLAGGVRLDGRLDEAAWQTVPAASDFTQQDPDEGRPAVQRTEVRFLVDGQALYVGARMYDTGGAAGVHGRLVRRDQQQDGDYLELLFDTFHDHAGRTLLQVNPAGSRTDLGQASPELDASWDPIWQVATQVDSLGWTAELRVPLAQLRFPADSLQTWGLQIWRYEERTNETSMWAFWKKDEAGGAPRFGHLEGLQFGARPAAIELLPYLVSRAAYVRPGQPGSPYQRERDYRWRAGADVKAVLGSTLTLDATVNPDFGQVEADPAEVNLSAYESYFSEKRPFFVEGSGLFSFGGFNCFFCSNVSSMSLFYSRRIGRPPHGGPPAEAVYAEQPENTPILGAAKVTGRTRAGLQVGLLDATTAATRLRYTDAAGQEGRQKVEPFTNYFVGRLRQNLSGGRLRLGVMGTSVLRDLNEPTLQALLPSHAEALGTDWELTWQSQRYRFMGNLVFSNVSGRDSAIAGLQRSSARYFQRPDRGAHGNGLLSNAYDPAATALRGLGGYARLSKDQGKLQWETAVNFRSPGFETNDLAYLTRADYVWMNGNVMGYFSQPTRWYRTLTLIGGAQQQYSFQGDRTDRQFQLYAGGQLRNYWYFNSFVIYKPDFMDDRATRGGPVVPGSGYRFAHIGFDSDGRKRVQFGGYPEYGVGNDGFRFWDLGFYVRVRAASNLVVSFEPYYDDGGTSVQYVQAFDDPAATAFYGRRVVFADVRRHTLSLDTRVSATFTPDLTLELFAQPYVATGHYTRFREYVRPRTSEMRPFDGVSGTTGEPLDVGNPDFSVLSLRGNAVLRWEWRPGSTLFLVWQQNRAGAGRPGDFALGRDARGIFEQRGDNVILLKLSYWFGR